MMIDLGAVARHFLQVVRERKFPSVPQRPQPHVGVRSVWRNSGSDPFTFRNSFEFTGRGSVLARFFAVAVVHPEISAGGIAE
jgi:hypothetical protein